jgi:phosphatidylglycerophosphatase A
MDKIIMFLATGFYSGNLPKAPGTWGSLMALVPWFFMRNIPLPSYLSLLAVIFVVGCLLAGSAEKILDQADAGPIVIDEFVGMFITLAAAPNHPAAWIIGFLLFRFFDVLKPFPCSWFDTHIHGGLGIMLDDVFAGLYALACLQLLWMFVDKL